MSEELARAGGAGVSGDPLANQSVESANLTGAQKALLFIVSIDERIATRILGHMNERELRDMRRASVGTEEIDAAAIIDVHREFVREIRDGVPTSLKGSSAYLRRIAGRAHGEGKVADLWEKADDKAEGPVAELARLDTATVLPILEREHPQTLAVVFSLMDSGRAGELLGHFPDDLQTEVLRRLATLKKVPDTVVRHIEEQFKLELDALGDVSQVELDGVDATASVLKRIDAERAEELIDELAVVDEEAATRVRRAMFTFENLIRVDARGMQALLKEITTDQLVLAMKTASDDLKEKIFASVSSRASAALRDELELMGPVRLSDVEEAQQVVVQAALQLEKDGRISIAREGGGDYV